jgi:hypothetical protein
MTEHIYPKRIKGKTYYYLQRTYREKMEGTGKTKGSGKSRVRTQSIYLGSAEAIRERLLADRAPVEVRPREFGLPAAALDTAVAIGLVELLQREIPGERFGLPRWLFFLLPILNRIDHATSKERMGEWAARTALPELLGFDPGRLNSKTFWYVTDDVSSERELQERRRQAPELGDDLFVGLDDAVFRRIEAQLFSRLSRQLELSGPALLYDTTNFFTYIEEPARSRLARSGHSKDCRHHLKQVGLAMAVEQERGLPLFHRVYRGNSQDARTFAGVIEELLQALGQSFTAVEDLVLVLDKGNNSPKNFAALAGKVQWVGSLCLAHFPDLLALPLENYTGQTDGARYCALRRTVMDADCQLVLTYNPKLARKQEHSLQNGIEKLKAQIVAKAKAYRRPSASIPAGIKSLLKKSRYGKHLRLEWKNRQPSFQLTPALEQARLRFGKNLLFTSNPNADPGSIIAAYKSKDLIEDSFKLLKDPELIRWRPSRHFTDTKLRAFAFCCVMALVIIRVMLAKTEQAGLHMSAAVLKQELADLKHFTLIYQDLAASSSFTKPSTIQQQLANLFHLDTYQQRLTIH